VRVESADHRRILSRSQRKLKRLARGGSGDGHHFPLAQVRYLTAWAYVIETQTL